jgi:cytochrome P450
MTTTPATKLPPGTSGLPLLGETLPFLRDIFGFISTRMDGKDGIFRTSVLGKPTVFLSGPEACALWIDESIIQREGSFPPNLQELFGGRSLPLLDGEAHLLRKTLVMQAMSTEALGAYLPVLTRTVSGHLDRWAKSGSVLWVEEFKRLALEGIAACLFGLGPGAAMDALLGDYQTLMKGFTGLPVNVPGTAYSAGLKARDRILARLEELVTEREKAPTDDGVSRLIAARGPQGEQLTVEAMKLELHHMVIAGIIIFADFLVIVTELAAQPALLDRLLDEIRKVAPTGPLLPPQLRQAPLLLETVMEAKRVTRNVPVSFGKAKKDFEFHGYTVPAGWHVFLAVGENNRQKSVFADPERFDPDRFGPGRAEHESHPHAFVPQGPGPQLGHKCAGLDFSTLFMQVFVALLVRGYTWEIPQEQDFSLRLDIVPPEPRGGLRAFVRPR